MFEKSGFNLIFSLILLNLAFQICYSEDIGRNYEESSNLVSCFDPPFEGLEIPGRGIFMVHKGHRLIPLTTSEKLEFCDSPRNLFEIENDIWDNSIMIPKDYEEFSQLINEAKDVAEKDEQIISALNDLLIADGGAKSNEKTDNIGMHVANEPIIIPEYAFPLHGNSHPHTHTDIINKSDEEISDFEDSSLLDDLDIPKNDNDGVKMRIFMFKEFSMDYLARKGLPLNINEEAMYTPENFEFFNSNWPSKEKELTIEILPNSIWRVFLASGILTSQTATSMSEEMRKNLVLESLNLFFNGLERYYLQNMDSELTPKYYLYLSGLGIESALDTIKYYRESEKLPKESGVDNSLMSKNNDKEYIKSQELTSNDLSTSSITSSSLEVPETIEESSIPRSVSGANKLYENNIVAIDTSKGEKVSQKSIKSEETQATEINLNTQLEMFGRLRIRWFSVFVNDYLGRLGINFAISKEYCEDSSTIEFFKTEIGVSEGLPEVIWNMFMKSGFGRQFPDTTSEAEKINIVNDIWMMFNQVERQMFKGQVNTEDYLLKKDLFDVEIREIMRQYWDGNLSDTANKLIHLSKKRTGTQENSEIKPIFEDELIQNQEKEIGIFKVEKSKSSDELSNTTKEIPEMYNIGSEIEYSRTTDSSKKSELGDKSAIGNKKGRNKKRKSKNKKNKRGKAQKNESADKHGNEKTSGILNKAKEFLNSFKKEPEVLVSEKSKEKSPLNDLSSESSSEDVEKNNDFSLNLLNFGSPIKEESEKTEFSEKFGLNTPFEKSFENSQELKQLGKESSLHSQKKNELDEKSGNLEKINEIKPEKSEFSTSLKEVAEEREKIDSFEQSPKKEPSLGVFPENTIMTNLFEDIPLAEESVNSEDSVKLEENEDIIKTKDQIPEDTDEKSMGKVNNGLSSHYETTSVLGNEDSENNSVPNYQEKSRVDYEPTREISIVEPSTSGQYSQKEDVDASGEETKKEDSKAEDADISDKEKPIKKKFSKIFENKLSSLFANTKKFFGFDKKSSKENKVSTDLVEENQHQDLDVQDEYENLTKMIIRFIQSYAALRYKFTSEEVIDNSFNEINEIVKSSVHFHQGTTEFDNVDMEKAIKKIAGTLGGGSFTALKSIGLTAKDITVNLKRYLIKLFPTERTEQQYKNNKKLNTTHFWLKQYFTQDLIKEGMIPEQLERPFIIETSQDLVSKANDPKSIETRAENICKKIPSILKKFFDISLTKKISHTDLDCIAVATVNELYGFSLSNSLYLFLFAYKTNYWRFLTPDISVSISQVLKDE
ncbi:uncharacterized protein ELE39_000884 [Cryptosporidium sp. chipmunk genotype I]|uniref:uncharacterized protein n=1 Tax=Cryptosporidium sp. chipmunk genotype I TaxID=1280935 RepID=UPI00351A9A26|nr:secreted protein [Cryptosporidium sp. chipmunk genotype I]